MEGILVDRNFEAASEFTSTIRFDLSVTGVYGKRAKKEETNLRKQMKKEGKREKSKKKK